MKPGISAELDPLLEDDDDDELDEFDFFCAFFGCFHQYQNRDTTKRLGINARQSSSYCKQLTLSVFVTQGTGSELLLRSTLPPPPSLSLIFQPLQKTSKLFLMVYLVIYVRYLQTRTSPESSR